MPTVSSAVLPALSGSIGRLFIPRNLQHLQLREANGPEICLIITFVSHRVQSRTVPQGFIQPARSVKRGVGEVVNTSRLLYDSLQYPLLYAP